MKNKIIQVKQHHIDLGVAGSPNCCPVALALKAARYKEVDVCIHPYQGYLIYFADWFHYKKAFAPNKVIEFIKNFDSGLEVKPFDFELDVCQKSFFESLRGEE